MNSINWSNEIQILVDENENGPTEETELGQLFIDKFFTHIFDLVDENQYENHVYYSEKLDMVLINYVSTGDYVEATGGLKEFCILKK